MVLTFAVALPSLTATGAFAAASLAGAATPPTVTTGAVSSITTGSATIAGTVDPAGAATTWYVQYGRSTAMPRATEVTDAGSSSGSAPVSVSIPELIPGSTYYYRVSATNAGGLTSGVMKTFLTPDGPSAPISYRPAATIDVSTIALVNSTEPRGSAATAWVEYGTTPSLGSVTPDQTLATASGTTRDAWTATVSGLQPHTTYYYRLRATNAVGTRGTDTYTATTLGAAPTVSSAATSSVGQTGATISASANPQLVASTAWVEYGTTSSLGTRSPSQAIGSDQTDHAVSGTLAGLTPGTTYYARVTSSNSVGQSSSPTISFTTASAAVPPTYSATTLSNVTTTGATIAIVVNPHGSATNVSVEYGATTGYGARSAVQQISTPTASNLSFSLSGLPSMTTFHYRVVITSAPGSAATGDRTFLTLGGAPTVSTAASSAVGSGGATVSGSGNPHLVSSDGWVEYGRTASLGSSSPSQALGSDQSDHAISAALTGLAPATTYYARIASSNSVGRASSPTVSFTTAAVAPSVANASASAITTSGAAVAADVNGNASTASVTVRYGTTTAYGGQTSAQQVSGSSRPSFALTGLAASTTYHFQVVASSPGGSASTSDQTFATLGGGAPTYGVFVSTTGSDSANGSLANPWRTLQHAVNTVAPGGTVWLRAGVYTGAVITRSGASAAAPTTIASYPNEVATVGTPPSGANTIDIKSGAAHIVLSRLIVSGAVGVYHAGVMVEGNASDVHVINSTLRDNHSFGLRTYQVGGVEVRSSLITGNDTGIMINYGGEGVSITGNQINSNTGMVVNDATPGNDNGANGIQFVKSTGNITVTGNTVAHNRALSHDYGWDGGAFEVYAASNVHISGNVTYDNQDVLETGTDSGIACAANTFTDNVNWGGNDKSKVASHGPVTSGMLLRCAKDMIISHNTFDDLDWYVYDISNSSRFSGAVDGLQITDNLNLTHQLNGQVEKVYCFEIAVPSTVTIDRNLSWNTTGGTLASFSGHPDTTQLTDVRAWTNADLNGMQADPHLTDPANHDYRTTSQTPVPTSGTRIFNG